MTKDLFKTPRCQKEAFGRVINGIYHEEIHPYIHFLHLDPNVFLAITKSRKSQSVLSNVFLISTLTTQPFFFFLLYSSYIREPPNTLLRIFFSFNESELVVITIIMKNIFEPVGEQL